MFVKFSKVRDKTYCAVFLWYKKFWRAQLGVVDFIYDIKSLDLIEFLFEREFMYVWNRKWFPMIWLCIWFEFNIIGIAMACA